MRQSRKIIVTFAVASLALAVGVVASAQNLSVKGTISGGTPGVGGYHSLYGTLSVYDGGYTGPLAVGYDPVYQKSAMQMTGTGTSGGARWYFRMGTTEAGGFMIARDAWLTQPDNWFVANTLTLVPTSTNINAAVTLYNSGNIVNSKPSQGQLGLTGDLPGYAVDTYPTLKSTGAYLYVSIGGVYSAYVSSLGVWTANSSRDTKENFRELAPGEALARIAKLSVPEWNYKGEDRAVRHIGPIAEDFHAAFGLNGASNKMVSHIDPAGVALAGLKDVARKLDEQQRQLEEQQREIAQLKARLASGR
jgi:hypothetical protein